MRKRFVIFDRDGTLIEERHYLRVAEQVELLPHALDGLARLRSLDFGLVMLTNQSGVQRGLYTREQVDAVHARLTDLLSERGISLDGIYVCPHTPEANCDCRKPGTGLAMRAARDLGFDVADSFCIGDKECDVELGRRLGAITILVSTGYGAENRHCAPDFFVADLNEAAELLERIVRPDSVAVPRNLVEGAADRLRGHLYRSIATKQRCIDMCQGDILNAASLIVDCLRQGGKLLICGNGGSAADAQHMAAELVGVLTQSFPRPGLAAISLATDTSILTANANDFGFDGVFQRQVQALGSKGDVLLTISTSGSSKNVVLAVQYAAEHGMRTIALTGNTGGDLRTLANVAIRVPSFTVQHIQEAHIAIEHILCDLVERTLFANKTGPAS